MSQCLRVAIVHYHLRRGGVTKVIEQTVASMHGEAVELVILSGEAPDASSPLHRLARVIPELAYAEHHPEETSEKIFRTLHDVAHDALGGQPDVWHIHNHSLGKTPVMPAIIATMAHAGERLLLQIHDFPEDGRPNLYRRQMECVANGRPEQLYAMLYPTGPNIHYAVINPRDAHFLQQAGADVTRLHLLPNAVSAPPADLSYVPLDIAEGKRLVLYPTRSIRRKNMGELLLWSILTHDYDTLFAATLAPQNPTEHPPYAQWMAFAAEHQLSVRFGIGEHLPFENVIRGADAFITTSMMEGFGMAFLEAWHLNRPLVGRALPEVTDAFAQEGLDLSALYTRVMVPLSWIGKENYAATLESGLRRSREAYGIPYNDTHLAQALHASTHDGRVDFGRLDQRMQTTVLRHLLEHPADKACVSPQQLSIESSNRALSDNRQTVTEKYSLPAYGKRLFELYQRVASSQGQQKSSLDGARLLAHYLAPERFLLITSA